MLPPLDSHAPVNLSVKAAFAVASSLLCIGTLIALMTYFTKVWRKAKTAPNRTAYVVWIGIETIAALSVVFGLTYSTIRFASGRFR